MMVLPHSCQTHLFKCTLVVLLAVFASTACIPIREHSLEFAPLLSAVADSGDLRVAVGPVSSTLDSTRDARGPYIIAIFVRSSQRAGRMVAVREVQMLGLTDSTTTPVYMGLPEPFSTDSGVVVAVSQQVKLLYQDFQLTGTVVMSDRTGQSRQYRIGGVLRAKHRRGWTFWPWSFFSV